MLSLDISYWRGGWITVSKWKIKSSAEIWRRILELGEREREIWFNVNDSVCCSKRIYMFLHSTSTSIFLKWWPFHFEQAQALYESQPQKYKNFQNLLRDCRKITYWVLAGRRKPPTIVTLRWQSKLQWGVRSFTLLPIQALHHVILQLPPDMGSMTCPAPWHRGQTWNSLWPKDISSQCKQKRVDLGWHIGAYLLSWTSTLTMKTSPV